MKLLLILTVLSLCLSGCGDLLGKKVVKRELDSSRFSVNCDLDISRFSEILNENIAPQIRCLGENLNLFVRVVKSGKPGYLSRIQLEKYLAKFRPDVQPEVIKALKSIFELGHLITGEEVDYISKATIDKVVNFVLIFNEEAALNFGRIFKNESQVSYALHQNHRDRVSGANKAIVGALRSIFNTNRGGKIHSINIIELLESFTSEDNRQTIEDAKKLLFAKKILLGGENETLTHLELEKLILNFDHIVLIALDVVRYKYIDLKQDSILQLLKRDVNDLYDMVTQGSLNNRDQDVLFTMNDVINVVKTYVSADKFDVEKFRYLIGEAKKIIANGNADVVKGIELKNIFNHAKSILKTGTVFHRIYEKFLVQLESPQPVAINFDEYRHTYPEHQTELDQFERIVKKYRFMRGEFLSPYYTRAYRRNASAIFEIALYEYVLKLVFKTYGSPSPNNDAVGGYSINKDQMQALLKRFETELIELDLIYPNRAASLADNISLLGTLFQYQSDKNNVLDVNEGTEFAGTVLTSMSVQDDIHDYLKTKKCSTDEFGRFEPGCFKDNFWQGLCKSYRQYFPQMFESLDFPKNCEDFQGNVKAAELLQRSVDAARTCSNYTDGDKEEVPYAKGDIMTTMVVLMHVETTILRWDTNNNNILDPDEVMKAYDIYGPALDGFLESQSPVIRNFKKQIYQYLIKYEEVPDAKNFGSIMKFVKFLLKFNKKAPATRKTMASILVAISAENAKTATGPQFNCNYLRDPENIPRFPEPVTKELDTREDLSSILIPYLHLAN